VGAVGQWVGGLYGDRFEVRKGYLLFHALGFFGAFTMAWVANIPLFLATMFYIFFLLGMQPLENTLVARLSPPAFKHSAYGVKFVLTFGIGSLSVIVAGAIEKAWGLSDVFLMVAGVTVLLVATISLLIWRTQPIR